MSSETQPDYTLLEELADEYQRLEAETAPKLARMDEIKKHFRGLEPGHTHDVGGLVVTVGHNRTLDAKALAKAYPPAEHPDFYEPKLSTSKVREHLDEDMLEDFTRVGEHRVTIKEAAL